MNRLWINGHSTKIHHYSYEKKGFFTLQFCIWMCKFAMQGSLLSFLLAARQNVIYHLMCNLSVILITATPSLLTEVCGSFAWFERQHYFSQIFTVKVFDLHMHYSYIIWTFWRTTIFINSACTLTLKSCCIVIYSVCMHVWQL